jgi:hypothetical protein
MTLGAGDPLAGPAAKPTSHRDGTRIAQRRWHGKLKRGALWAKQVKGFYPTAKAGGLYALLL